jgi:hypothetical protein
MKISLIVRGKNKTNSQNNTEIEQARIIKRTLGAFTAARYLAKRNWSLDATLFVLFGTVQRYAPVERFEGTA